MENNSGREILEKLKKRMDTLNEGLQKAKQSKEKKRLNGMPLEKIVIDETNLCDCLFKKVEALLSETKKELNETALREATLDAEWFWIIDYRVSAAFKKELLDGLSENKYCHAILDNYAAVFFKDKIVDKLFVRTQKKTISEFKHIVEKWKDILKVDTWLGELPHLTNYVVIPDNLNKLFEKYEVPTS